MPRDPLLKADTIALEDFGIQSHPESGTFRQSQDTIDDIFVRDRQFFPPGHFAPRVFYNSESGTTRNRVPARHQSDRAEGTVRCGLDTELPRFIGN